MRVLHVCAEVYPLLKTGGLADVAGALPLALNDLGCDVRLLLPGFPKIISGIHDLRSVSPLRAWGIEEEGDILFGTLPNSGLGVFVASTPLFDRPGNPYQDAQGLPYADNHRRFALLGRVATGLAEGKDTFWRPAVVHLHDWHAGLAAAYLAAAGRPAGCIFTIHNLAYQGVFEHAVYDELSLPPDFYRTNGVEYFGQWSFMKAGLYYADKLTTVSPTYAREIQTPEFGCGLNGLLSDRAADLSGILNGVDYAIWDPNNDPALSVAYSEKKLAGKAACKTALQATVGLDQTQTGPLFSVVSRLTEQKGLDLVLKNVDRIVAKGGQLVILGTGDAYLEDAFREQAAKYPGQVAVHIGYDEALSHCVFAGSDLTMVPSRFEPCGLTQLYALRYGTLPIVRRVGGLADSVADTRLETLDTDATGFVFDDAHPEALHYAIVRAFALFARPKDWKQIQKRGMAQRFGWDTAARQYLALYEQIAHPA